MTVDKTLFQSLLHRYANSSAKDVEDVLSLKAQYPYSQLLSILAAKLLNDHQRDVNQQELQAAAIRSADRTVLREVMDNEIDFSETSKIVDDHHIVLENIVAQKVEQPKTLSEQPVIEEAKKEKKIVVYEADVANINYDGADLADQVMKDLEKLSASRHNFEMLFVEYAEVKSSQPRFDTDVKTVEHALTSDAVREKENAKSRKQRIIEMAKARTAAPSAAVETIEETKKKRNADGKESPTEELIKDIITTKEEITPDTPKQQEQIDIINHFIQKQPSITSARDKQPAPITDLNPIKTGEFGDNIVSETLVEILIKQGKKDKAIEVLKKLIWKYPQKKAYFASQIEELKK
jgi:hypothetical protein